VGFLRDTFRIKRDSKRISEALGEQPGVVGDLKRSMGSSAQGAESMDLLAERVENQTDEQKRAQYLARNGGVGRAVVVASADTGKTGPYSSHELELTLDVTIDGQAPYRATSRQFVGPMAMSKFAVGATVVLRFDPKDHSQVFAIG